MTTTTKESEVFETLSLIKYDVNLAQIAKLKAEYMPLVITDLADKEQFEAVHAGRMTMVKVRTTIEKARVRQKASALKYGRDVDAAAKELLTESEPVEAHLQAEEDKVINEQKRLEAEAAEIEKAKIQKRVDALFAYNVILPYMDVATMSDEEFENLRQKSEEAWSAEKVRLANEEAARIQKDKELADERAELDRRVAQQVKIDKEQANKEKALRIEREKFEKEKKKAQEVKERAELEAKEKIEREKREAREAEAKAELERYTKAKDEKEAKEKIEREAKELKEREEAEKAEAARQEALKPDKEKLITFAEKILQLTETEISVSNEGAVRIFSNAIDGLLETAKYINEEAEVM